MAWVYILRGSNGRRYIGSTVDLEAWLTQHQRGFNPRGSTKTRACFEEEKVFYARDLSLADVEQPRKTSGLVGSSILPCGRMTF